MCHPITDQGVPVSSRPGPLTAVTVAVLLAACTGSSETGTGVARPVPPGDEPIDAMPTEVMPGMPEDFPGDIGPGPFTLASGPASVEVAVHTYCWTDEAAGAGMCADGFPDPSRAVLTATDRVLTVTFQRGGELTATVGADEVAQPVPVTPVDGGWDLDLEEFEPGEYVLSLDWRDGDGNDASASATLRVP